MGKVHNINEAVSDMARQRIVELVRSGVSDHLIGRREGLRLSPERVRSILAYENEILQRENELLWQHLPAAKQAELAPVRREHRRDCREEETERWLRERLAA